MSVIVSVVIPVYNAEKSLEKCVESLVYGVERRIEIILVDDCSTDESWRLCQKLENKYNNVRAYQNKCNSGVSHTRNEGIRQSKGQYIVFVDSDDWVSKNYILELLKKMLCNKVGMVICGFHYINLATGNKTLYIYQSNKLVDIKKSNVVEFYNLNLIQTCWNKIYDLNQIKQNNIIFDENLKIGEDFRFVLEYMNCVKDKPFIYINQPLYYYVDAQDVSAMGNFGWSPIEYAVQNLKMMAKLYSLNEGVANQLYDRVISNQIYHIVRTKQKSKSEKLARIKELTQDVNPGQQYNKQRKAEFKENIIKQIGLIKQITTRVKNKLIRLSNEIKIKNSKRKLNNSQCTVISQNCIGGVFYHDMNIKFLSPTINLFFMAEDFVKFVLNIKEYLSMELEMHWGEMYPIGKLGDINIHFMHYSSCSQAKEAWNKRKERIDFNNMLIVSTDRNGFDEKVYEQWKEIPYNKLLFTVNDKFKSNSTVIFNEFENQKYVPDLIENRKFYKNGILIKMINGVNRV